MTAPWIPDDGELDALARSLPAPDASAAVAEQNRTRMLAAAANQTPRARRPIAAIAIAAGVSLAAAAALVVWWTRAPASEPAARVGTAVAITPTDGARLERVSPFPDFVVHVRDGSVALQVAALAPGERFRVRTGDAEIEIRGESRFTVDAVADHVDAVAVATGEAELRVIDGPRVIIKAGTAWHAPTKTAVIERAPLVTPPPPPKPDAPPAKRPERRTPHRVTTAPSPSPSPAPTNHDEPPPPPAPPAASPGELEFRTGWTALRANRAGDAATSFAKACTLAGTSALAEDACFWAGAAAKRAGDAATARTALARFVATFPSSPRANEARALLGWLYYDAGDLAAAKPLFERAATDRVPRVRDSAERGRLAIERH
ncbi:MAG TPA: tetratricopeptide repeat protein [Kofleriaceae bacterium]|nr:tetratricopeptide repeat protein [Kofleriaceae bacterium]